MGYLATWRVLEGIITEFRKKGLPVPATVMSDLKAAKTLIELVDYDSKREMTPRVEQYLSSVEGYLVTAAQGNFPPKRIDEWLREIEKATSEASCENTVAKEESRFISGLPRDQKWIRVEPSPDLSPETLKQLAEEAHVSFRIEKDGHFVVYGRAEAIKDFIKKMTEKAH